MSANHRNGQRNKKVRVAIVGVGNCASSLVQGVHYYRDASPKDSVPGLMHVDLGGYHIRDIEFVAAFDIDKNKVGLDLSEAIDAKPNNTVKFADVPRTGVRVQHYAPVGSALLWTLEKALGAAFTPAVRDACATAYIVLSTTMIDAANERPPLAA